MTDKEAEFRDRLAGILGPYCPSDGVLSGLAVYLYREVISVLRGMPDEDARREISEEVENSELELGTFRKLVADMAVYAAQNITLASVKTAFDLVKNRIPVVSRVDTGQRIPNQSEQQGQSTPYQSGLFNQNEGEFEIDLREVDSVRMAKRVSKTPESVTNTFDAGDLGLEVSRAVGKRESISSHVVVTNSKEEFYDKVPDIDVGLDY